VELFKRKNSGSWWYDFTVRGERFRGSTKETKKAAAHAKAARMLTEISEGRNSHHTKKAPVLSELSGRFLDWVATSRLETKTRAYYQNGWKLLEKTDILGMRIDQIRSDNVEALNFPGSPSNANNALRTLRRLLHKAEEWGLIAKVSRFKLVKEFGRTLRLDDEAERKLSPFADQLLREVIILMRDTGMRNQKELLRMRIADIDWNRRAIFVPDSKTPAGRRFVPMSDRVLDLLMVRCAERREGWVFPAKSESGHLTTVGKKFRKARTAAGLPKELKLYCARHDFGTRVLQGTGNMAAVMRSMGHSDPKVAMQYQHPEMELVRMAINSSNPEQERRAN
jgi:integrase